MLYSGYPPSDLQMRARDETKADRRKWQGDALRSRLTNARLDRVSPCQMAAAMERSALRRQIGCLAS